MNLLLDTHTFIWFLNGDSRLSQRAIRVIEDLNNRNFISTASIWELTIKSSIGKLKLKGNLVDLKNQFFENGFELLPISFEHMITLHDLEPYHRDPFDRLIIAQAISDGFTVISRDQNFQNYHINIIW